jgi:hypothetical protein
MKLLKLMLENGAMDSILTKAAIGIKTIATVRR